jgi:hypothetical protein
VDTIIEDELRVWLEALAATTAAGAKAYPWGEVPQDPAYPHLTYHRVAGSRMRTLRGPNGVSYPRVQLDVWARSYGAAKNLAAAVRVALEAWVGAEQAAGRTPRFVATTGRILQAVIVHDESDAAEEPGHGDEVSEFRVTLDTTIWFRETS